MATKQETFDIVAGHLLKQGQQSIGNLPNGGGGSCLYRGPNGVKCAAGALIPDAEYSPAMEGSGVRGTTAGDKIIALGHDIDLVDRLQMIHDTHPVREWPAALKGAAKDFDLEWRHESMVK